MMSSGAHGNAMDQRSMQGQRSQAHLRPAQQAKYQALTDHSRDSEGAMQHREHAAYIEAEALKYLARTDGAAMAAAAAAAAAATVRARQSMLSSGISDLAAHPTNARNEDGLSALQALLHTQGIGAAGNALQSDVTVQRNKALMESILGPSMMGQLPSYLTDTSGGSGHLTYAGDAQAISNPGRGIARAVSAEADFAANLRDLLAARSSAQHRPVLSDHLSAQAAFQAQAAGAPEPQDLGAKGVQGFSFLQRDTSDPSSEAFTSNRNKPVHLQSSGPHPSSVSAFLATASAPSLVNHVTNVAHNKDCGHSNGERTPTPQEIALAILAQAPKNVLKKAAARRSVSQSATADHLGSIAAAALLGVRGGPGKVDKTESMVLDDDDDEDQDDRKKTVSPLSASSVSSSSSKVEDNDAYSSRTEQWAARFKELCEFRRRHGHCLVPHKFRQSPRLAQWVKRQRFQYKRKVAGHHSTVTDERERALEGIGFVWDSHRAVWEEKYGELEAYCKAEGHCRVPTKYGENPQLSIWVKCQRRQHKLYITGGKRRSTMSAERIAKLDSLGFDWNPRNLKVDG